MNATRLVLAGLGVARAARLRPRTRSSPIRSRNGDAAAGKALVQKDCVALPRAALRRHRDDLHARRPPGAARPRSCWRRCSSATSQLKSGYFPEDEENVAAYLNQQYYKFKP